MDPLKPTYVVGIGGSAGGLSAYKSLLEGIPSDTGMAFVIVAHLSPTHESLLVQILTPLTQMPVVEACDGCKIEPNHVYIIQPNTDLRINNFNFQADSPRTLLAGRHKQVDYFLKSLSEEMGPRAISVILSGYDGDGTEGSLSIKAMGGMTFAQDLSAEVDSMPLHARASGSIDWVLPTDKIAEHLTVIARAPVIASPDS